MDADAVDEAQVNLLRNLLDVFSAAVRGKDWTPLRMALAVQYGDGGVSMLSPSMTDGQVLDLLEDVLERVDSCSCAMCTAARAERAAQQQGNLDA